MKNKFKIISSLVLGSAFSLMLNFSLNANNYHLYDYVYGSLGDPNFQQGINHAIETQDSNIAMVMYTQYFSDSLRILKVNKSGGVIWERLHVRTSSGFESKIIQLNNQDLLTYGGFSGNASALGEDVEIIRVSNNNSTYSYFSLSDTLSIYDVYVKDLIKTANGDYVVTGSCFNGTSRDIFVARFDENDNLLWTQILGDPANNESAFSITESNIGEIYLTTGIISSSYNSSIELTKLSPTGSHIFTNTLTSDFATNHLVKFANGNLIVAYSEPQTNIHLLYVNEITGNVNSTASIPISIPNDFWTLTHFSHHSINNTLMFAGGYYSDYIITDINGNKLYEFDDQGINPATNDTFYYAHSVVELNNGGYLVAGHCTTVVSSTYDTKSFLQILDSTLVWPGDANSNGVANVFDVFPIGIAYNTTGPVRSGATNAWIGQAASDWSQNFASGVNYKHADCNGDGTIDYLDGLPILLNYGLTHSKGDVSATVTDPTLFYELPVDTTMVSIALSIPIMLGTPSIPAQDVYGIAFTVTFDPALVDTSSVDAVFNNSWLGIEGTDMFTIQKRFGASGELHIGMVRTNQVNISSAFGQIATLNIVTTDDLSGKTNTYENLVLGFKDVKMISLNETEQLVNTSSSTLVIGDVSATVSMHNHVNQVLIYPNPTQNILTIEHNQKINEVSLYNISGQQVYKNENFSDLKVINMQELPQGSYFLHLQSEEGIIVKKVIKK